eukprot:UN26632
MSEYIKFSLLFLLIMYIDLILELEFIWAFFVKISLVFIYTFSCFFLNFIDKSDFFDLEVKSDGKNP